MKLVILMNLLKNIEFNAQQLLNAFVKIDQLLFVTIKVIIYSIKIYLNIFYLGNTLKCIADIVELFITFLDQLKLNIRAVDELFPNLTELLNSINAMSQLPDDFDAKIKVKAWFDYFKVIINNIYSFIINFNFY